MDFSKELATQFSCDEKYVSNIITLLDEGNTIPFIARYRKELHGSMDDQKIREIAEQLEYLRTLEARREEVRELIAAQEKLTDEINEALNKAKTLAEINDIYLPFRPKRKTKASVARARGLEPLADLIYAQTETTDPLEMAEAYINFLCRSDVALANAEYVCYGSPQKEVRELLDPEISNDPLYYPDITAISVEAFKPLPAETNRLMDVWWTKLKQ